MTLIIMVSVYSILYDSNLFDSRFRFIRFLRWKHWISRSPFGSLEGNEGKGVPPLEILISRTQLLEYSEFIKIAFQIINLTSAKINHLFHLRYVSFSFPLAYMSLPHYSFNIYFPFVFVETYILLWYFSCGSNPYDHKYGEGEATCIPNTKYSPS